MKGDSGRRQLIPAPGESSFPGLGWGRRVGNWRAGEEGPGGSWRQPVTDVVLSALEQEQKWSPRAVCLNIPVINQAKELLNTIHSALPP